MVRYRIVLLFSVIDPMVGAPRELVSNGLERHGYLESRGDCSKETKMRFVVASLFMTLDGVVEAPEGWNSRFADGELEAVLTERMAEQDTILLGRRTYEDFSQTWPVSVSPLAPDMNATRKVVVSETLPAVAWQNAVLIEEPIADQLAGQSRHPAR
jgi:hypothetical protein